jgi:hypothetical protein
MTLQVHKYLNCTILFLELANSLISIILAILSIMTIAITTFPTLIDTQIIVTMLKEQSIYPHWIFFFQDESLCANLTSSSYQTSNLVFLFDPSLLTNVLVSIIDNRNKQKEDE